MCNLYVTIMIMVMGGVMFLWVVRRVCHDSPYSMGSSSPTKSAKVLNQVMR